VVLLILALRGGMRVVEGLVKAYENRLTRNGVDGRGAQFSGGRGKEPLKVLLRHHGCRKKGIVQSHDKRLKPLTRGEREEGS